MWRKGIGDAYGDVFVLDEQAVEEPDDGADGEGEGEREGHELHAPRAHHLVLRPRKAIDVAACKTLFMLV